MSSPEENDWTQMKRMGRYIKGEPRLVQCFKFQNMPDSLDSFADADFAGCIKTRKSTSGGAIKFGAHCIKSWSSTQSVIALSSGEAEYYSLVKTASQSIGIRNMLRDVGISVGITINTDSSTAKSIALRKGVGKVRHIETNQLWLQDKVKSKDICIKTIGTLDNPADLMTKHLSREDIDKHLRNLGFSREDGRHHLAPDSDYIKSHENCSNQDQSKISKKVRWADQEEDGNEEDDPWGNYGICSISKNNLICATRSRRKVGFDISTLTIKPREEHECHPRRISTSHKMRRTCSVGSKAFRTRHAAMAISNPRTRRSDINCICPHPSEGWIRGGVQEYSPISDCPVDQFQRDSSLHLYAGVCHPSNRSAIASER